MASKEIRDLVVIAPLDPNEVRRSLANADPAMKYRLRDLSVVSN